MAGLVQVQQGLLQGHGDVPQFAEQDQVRFDPLDQFLDLALDHQVGALGVGWHPGQQGVEHHLGHRAAAHAQGADLRPGPVEPHLQAVAPEALDLQHAALRRLMAEAFGHRAQAAQQPVGVDSHVALGQVQATAQLGAHRPHAQRQRVVGAGLGGQLLHQAQQLDLQVLQVEEGAVGRAPHALAHRRSEAQVIGHHAELFESVQDPEALLGRHAGGEHQLVGADPLGRDLMEQAAGDRLVAFALHGLETGLPDRPQRLVQRGRPQAGREHLAAVVVAAHEVSALQPGHRRGDLGAGVGRIDLDVDALGFDQQLLGRDDHLAAVEALGPAADRLEQPLKISPVQPSAGGHAELGLDVEFVEQQHAARRLAVAAGTPGFLQVVFQRTGDVGMHDQPDVGLVHAHAEGVGGGDDLEFSGQELLLDVLLDVHGQAAVEGGAAQARLPEKFGVKLGGFAGGAEHHGGTPVAQALGEQLDQVLALLGPGGGDHAVAEVGAFVPAEKAAQLDAEFGPEVLGEVADDFLSGRGGEAGDRGGHAGEVLADEARDVKVVGAEVLPPARQAVRLVEHPGSDLSQAQGLGEGAVAKLFGGDQHDAGFAQANLVEGRAPFGRREHAVEGDRALDALPDEVVDLVLHQRLQRRDDDGDLAGARVVRQCRHLVADRLAAPGGQDGQQAGLVEAGDDDLALQRSAPGAGGQGPETGQPEMLLQQRFGVVVSGAVATVVVVTTVEGP